jgi:hypothetical protein
VRLPGKAPHEHLGERRVPELPCAAAGAARHRLRHLYRILGPRSLCMEV